MKLIIGLSFIFCGNTFAVNKVIYGQDNRVNALNSGIFWQHKSAAVASMIRKSKLKEFASYYKASTFMTLGEQYSLCSDERFYSEPVLSECSGFLISPDTLITAGHCVKALPYPYNGNPEKMCEDFVWSFDFTQTKAYENKVSLKQVYNCKEVIEAKYNFAHDYAIIKLEKAVEGVKPLKTAQLVDSTELVVIGHPSGLPKKVAPGGKVIDTNGSSSKFYAALDSFQGNSGSPVLDKAGDVVGILVSGKTDYIYDEKAQCQRVNRCDNNGKACFYEYDYVKGEGVTKIDVVLDKIPAGIDNSLSK
ncbi:MAG: hypothetical protein BM556_10525 [Bacteriovorax sp. MedPE-SWde]|nr:MAG: hypothetical protein BM556_10525 [Bacteriovorax sp. MedPE-SWde]